MIKFFRKIRHNLVSEGKTEKYLKYALGEILLVVLGILIAVQINNWNVNKQNEKKEILYLTRLTTNLGYDIRLYESIMAQDSLLLDTLSIVKNDLKEFIKTIDQPSEGFSFLITGNKFTSNRTVIDNLVSSGQIELLRSNYLVEDIFLYYRTTELIETGIDATIAAHNNTTVNNIILKFNSNNRIDSSYIKTIENSIHYRIDLIERQLKWYSSQKQLAEKLVKKINQEIQYIETIY